MNFNAMGFVLSREMARRELGSDGDNRANQLGLVGAMTPDPMMGAVMAMVIAKGETSPRSEPGLSAPFSQLPAGSIADGPVHLYVGDRNWRVGETVPFGSHFRDTSVSEISFPLPLVLKNPRGPTVKLSTDVSGTAFTLAQAKDDTFRKGDELGLSLAMKSLEPGTYSGSLFVIVDGNEFDFPVTGTIEDRPTFTVMLDNKPWTPTKPRTLKFTSGSQSKALAIENQGQVDVLVGLLPGCNVANYEFHDTDGGGNVTNLLRSHSLRIDKGVTRRLSLDASKADSGMTSLLISTKPKNPHWDDLLVALLDRTS